MRYYSIVLDRVASLQGGPLDGETVYIYRTRFSVSRDSEPAVITLAVGATQDEPWPHEWHDYRRQSDGSYRWAQCWTQCREAS